MSEKIIFKDFQNIVPMVKDRWSPIYLEYGRLEVDNYSIKFITSENTIIQIPVAMISCIMLGPGTTVTHAAIVSCSKTNTPLVWCGDDGIYFYSFGVNVNERCKTSLRHVEMMSTEENKNIVARRMFSIRFPDIDSKELDISTMRGMEGNRVRNTYRELSEKYKIPWVCRNTNGVIGIDVDDLNLSLNILNYNLYCLCLSVILTMGYIPSLGFFHSDGKIPFVYDIADLYKTELTFDVAFSCYVTSKRYDKELLMQAFSEKVAQTKLLEKIPKHLHEIFK